jgi:hypothetical protein
VEGGRDEMKWEGQSRRSSSGTSQALCVSVIVKPLLTYFLHIRILMLLPVAGHKLMRFGDVKHRRPELVEDTVSAVPM